MITYHETEILDVFIHRIGNKALDEGKFIADKPAVFNEENRSLLMHMFLSKFGKTDFTYHFSKSYNAVKEAIFQIGLSDYQRSAAIANHLYDLQQNPKTKGGELFIAEFKNIQYKGDLLNAVGIFKSETKETFIKSNQHGDTFTLDFENNGVSVERLDKGALILETGSVLCFDKDKSGFWKDEFLQLEVVKDDFSNTTSTLNVIKEFINEKLDEEFEIDTSDKVNLLNKSIKYFKEKESFDIDEFAETVIGNQEAATQFKNYHSVYSEEFDELPESFNISRPAVKKQSSAFKKVIKLDKNFHIYVHGNKELIENGFDNEKGLSFYKVYYKEEV